MSSELLELDVASNNRTLQGQASIEYLAFLDDHTLSCEYAARNQHRFCHLCKQWKEATDLLLEAQGV